MNDVTVGAVVSIVKFAVSVEPPPYAFPAVSVQAVPNVNTLVASSTSAVGVYVPVHVILSLEVIEANAPLTTATSSSLANAATDSENTIVTVEVSPDLRSVSLIVNELTVGDVVSIVKFAVVADGPVFPAVSV